MDKTCSRCRFDVDEGIVLCEPHGMAREALEVCRDALEACTDALHLLLSGVPDAVGAAENPITASMWNAALRSLRPVGPREDHSRCPTDEGPCLVDPNTGHTSAF